MRKKFDSYREIKVRTASQTGLIVMLYDEVIRCIDQVIELLESRSTCTQVDQRSRKIEEINKFINKAQDILGELMSSLDFDKGGGISRNLFELYRFFSDRLTESNIKKAVCDLPGVRKQLLRLREAWSVVDNDAISESVGRQEINIAG